MNSDFIKMKVDFLDVDNGFACRFSDYDYYHKKDFTEANVKNYLNGRRKKAEHNYQVRIMVVYEIVEQ